MNLLSKTVKRPTSGGGQTTGSPDGSVYRGLTDAQLLDERDRQRIQLDELARHPGGSPAISELRTSIGREVEQMTDELHRRARSRHPAARSSRS